MYYFMSLEQIHDFLLRFGINTSTFTSFELSTTFILFNLYKIIVIFIFGYIIYRIFLRIYDFIFGFQGVLWRFQTFQVFQVVVRL